MKQVHITISGHDQVGIIAAVSAELAGLGVNIVDISQTVLSERFTMVLVTDVSGATVTYQELSDKLHALASGLNLNVRIKQS